MNRLEQTRGINFELVRHFLARMLDGEWSSTPGQWQSVVVGAFALLFPAGMLLVREGSMRPGDAGKYRDLARLASPEPFRTAALLDELALLTLVFAVTGLLALIQWQSFFPSRRDYLSLAGLPIRPRQIFAARFATVLIFSTALVVVMNVLPSLIAPHEFGGRWQKNPSFLVNVGAQAAASGLGCFFVLFGIAAIQGVLLNTLSGRPFERVSVYVQGTLIGVLLLAGLYSGSIQEWPPERIAKLAQFGWAPPVWFAGLHERLLGDPDPFFHAMANRALFAVVAAAVLMTVTYLGSYRRYRRLLVEEPVHVDAPKSRRWSLLRLLARDPRQEAVMRFMSTTLVRSRVHRVMWLAYIGGAVAIMVNSSLINQWGEPVKFLVLFWPLSASVVLQSGFRHVLSIPAELPANWIFRLLESQGRKEWMSAVERIVMLYAIAPIYFLLFPVAVHKLGWPLALRMTALQVLVSLTIFELLFYSWQQLPFTCSYVPGKRPLIVVVGGYLAALGLAVPLLTLVIRAGSELGGLFPFFCAGFGGIWIWARRSRREGWGEARLLYEDLPEAMPDLGIRDLSVSGAGWHPAAEWQSAPLALPESPRPVAISLRLYRALAAAFPHEFKNAYEDEIVQVTEDAIEPIWRRYGVAGLARLLVDIAIRLIAEHVTELWQDIRYGVRVLAGSPGFTAVALISLSLGICVATSAFSELNGFALRDVPSVPKPDELVILQAPTSYPTYKRYRERGDLFSSTLAYIAPMPFGVSLDGHTERIWGHLVTASYFSTLGVPPRLGRVFDKDDEQPGQAPTLVVSYRFWQAHLGSDPSAIGKTLRINGRLATVIGVAPEEFQGASPFVYGADLWMPVWVEPRMAPELADNPLERRDLMRFHVVGRLKPGLTPSRAEAELDTVARQVEQEYGEEDRTRKGRRVTLLPGGKLLPFRKQDLPFLTGFFAVLGGMVLLIASSNVANMLLARAADRRKEIAVRLALGASRARLIRQLLTESMLVSAAAGVVGFLLSVWVMSGASQIKLPYPMPLTMDLSPDGRVLCFTLALTAFTGLAFGLVPALQATRADLSPALKDGGAVLLRRYRRLSLRNILMLSQVGGSLMLLLITGFLSLGFLRTMGTDVGFDTRNLYVISLDPVRDGYSGEQAAVFFPKLLDRVKLLPSISAASLADTTPMAMMGKPSVTFSADGAGGERAIHSGRKYVVGKDYFDTIGVPIVRGRAFRKEDEINKAPAVIVSEKLAQECWKGEDPLGRRIEVGYEEVPKFSTGGTAPVAGDRLRLVGKPQVFEVVGVAKNERDGVVMVASEAPPLLYLPLRPDDYARPSLQGLTLIVRSAPGVDALGAVRREIAAIDSSLTPFNARGMTEQIDQMMYPIRMSVWTYGCLGVVGLILASVGLAGLTAYSVAQRGREIGIRMALGARRSDVLGLVMKEGAVLVTAGTLIGLAGAWGGQRLLSAFLSTVAKTTGRSTSDPLLLVGAPLLLAVLALVACYVPARKSMRIDPAVALRQE